MTLYSKERISSADKISIKESFEERYKKLLGNKYDEFLKYSFTYLRKCIRVNTLKKPVDEVKQRLEDQGWVLEKVPWCDEGFFIQGHKTLHRFDIGNVIEHTLGYFYVQEASSMIPPEALFFDLKNLDKNEMSKLKVLDLAAAPGSKTTQLAMYMKNEGLIIANDVDVGRLKPLSMNLQRMGVTNTLVTMNAFQMSKGSTKPRNPFFKRNKDGEFTLPNDENGNSCGFDRILLDAPCSGTGTIRKSFKAMSMYSYGLVRRLSTLQKTLISHSFSMLKPGGVMVYSTCTQEPLENEVVVSYLLDKFPDAVIEKIPFNGVKSEPVLEFEDLKIRPELKDAIRIYPQDNDSEGFFICRIRKKDVV
jgi:16S rRNA C967 or C1407 C5-methylase (RsmB/RsmF family)